MTPAVDLRALSAAATPGPWEPWGVPGSYVHIWTGDERVVARDVPSQDAELIVWLVNRATTIADLIDAAEAVLENGEPPFSWPVYAARELRDALAALDADA